MMPVAGWVGQVTGLFAIEGNAAITNYDATWAHTAGEANWWAHMLIILGFLNYLPFSKHIHVLGSGPNILMRPLGPKGVMPKLELFAGAMDDPDAEPLLDNWGVGRIEDFTWKSLMDNYACTECARCTSNCPAYATDKPLSPMHLIHDLKDEMTSRGMKVAELKQLGVTVGGEEEEEQSDRPKEGPKAERIAALEKALDELEPLVGGRVQDETIWSCTTCGACQQVCPVFIEHPLKILQMRSHIVLNDETGRTPGDLTRTFDNIERSGNPWGLAQSERMQWAEGLDVPLIADKPDAEYLLFVGCAGAYSDTGKKASQALVRCLEAAGVSYAVLGNDESCTGDSLRRGGDEFRFQMLAQANVEMFEAAGVKKIITSCPHCFHTLKHEYPHLGGNYEVVHHTTFLNDLIASGKLKVEGSLRNRVTYHDSCYLGRWNDIYDEPRETVHRLVTGTGTALELERNREHGFCCGAGGARMWMEEEADKRVNVARVKEVVDAGAEMVAVACPFCKTMVSDGIKQLDKDEDIDVADIAELIAKSLPAASPGKQADA
jgi:Fe-S oxidoreductase